MKEEDKDLVDLIVTMYIAEAAHDVKQAECSWRKGIILYGNVSDS
jgi:hypothetical protein